MRVLALLLALAAASARADEPPPDRCGDGQRVGDRCATDDGTPGHCAQVDVQGNHADAHGVRATWKELVCVPSVTAVQRSLLPWLGAALGFLALVVGLATRPVRANRAPGLQSRE